MEYEGRRGSRNFYIRLHTATRKGVTEAAACSSKLLFFFFFSFGELTSALSLYLSLLLLSVFQSLVLAEKRVGTSLLRVMRGFALFFFPLSPSHQLRCLPLPLCCPLSLHLIYAFSVSVEGVNERRRRRRVEGTRGKARVFHRHRDT